MPIVRKSKIENIQQMSGEQLEEYLLSLPVGKEVIDDLFDHIELKLEETPCNHTLHFAMLFIMNRRLNFPKITAWLNDNGGYCDCKVLESMAEEWRRAFAE